MRRRLALLALAALALTAGCAGGVSEERLSENATYDWESDTTAKINITGNEYHAVYRVGANESLEIYRLDDLGGEQPVPVSALRFRYPNGTVVGPDRLGVEEEGSRVVVTPPAAGRVGYTGPTRPKSFATPALVAGSYEVVLPPGMRIGVPLLGTISPGGYERTIEADGRTHLRWDDLDRGTEIELQYYLQRDLYIFAGLLVALAVVAVVGVLYFRRQIRALAAQREATDIED
ncbi:MAG: DUF5803 family protein [Halobacteriaceae archaeon]